MEPIENENLKLSDIPFEDAEMDVIFEFAQSFDGYDYWGAERCGEIANERRNGTLIELRTCLFFEQRRYRHMAESPSAEDTNYIRILVSEVRKIVKAKPST